ncbi:MAG: hypothetical protein N3E39_02865 [Candidatus Methanomethylicia archaeon]|nr:hypothetical protein [Candidatus Methanomethylicia archaeon]
MKYLIRKNDVSICIIIIINLRGILWYELNKCVKLVMDVLMLLVLDYEGEFLSSKLVLKI